MSFEELVQIAFFWATTPPKLGDNLLRLNLSRFCDYEPTIERVLVEVYRRRKDV